LSIANSLTLGSGSVAACVDRAAIIAALAQGSATRQALANLVESYGYLIYADTLFQVAQDAPVCYAFRDFAGNCFAFFTGVQNGQGGIALWQGYLDSVPVGNVRTNSVGQDWAATAWTFLRGLISSSSNFWLAGHSAGGVVATYLTNLVQTFVQSSITGHLTTFGMPKPGNSRYSPALVAPDRTNWINVDDAVPLVPPTISSLDRFMAGLTVFQGQRLADYERESSVIQINLDNTLTATPPFNFTGIPQSTAVGNWLAAQTAGATTPHAIQVYQSRLAAYLAVNSPAVLPIASRIRSERVTEPSVAEVRRAQQEAVQIFFSDANRQNAVPVSIPPRQAFTAQRQGAVWTVNFGGVQVAVAPKKKRARALKNLGNAFLQKLQNEGVVNPQAILDQLNLYLQLAADPNGGFVPVLNTQP
jgi:hypothetical protein